MGFVTIGGEILCVGCAKNAGIDPDVPQDSAVPVEGSEFTPAAGPRACDECDGPLEVDRHGHGDSGDNRSGAG